MKKKIQTRKQWAGISRLKTAILVDVDGTLAGIYRDGKRPLRSLAPGALKMLSEHAPVFLWSIVGTDPRDDDRPYVERRIAIPAPLRNAVYPHIPLRTVVQRPVAQLIDNLVEPPAKLPNLGLGNTLHAHGTHQPVYLSGRSATHVALRHHLNQTAIR